MMKFPFCRKTCADLHIMGGRWFAHAAPARRSRRSSGRRPTSPAQATAGSGRTAAPQAYFFCGFVSVDPDGFELSEGGGFGGSGLLPDPAELVFCLPDCFGSSGFCDGGLGFSGGGGAAAGFNGTVPGFADGGSFCSEARDVAEGPAA